MNFNRDKFFDGLRDAFGSLLQARVDALGDILTFIETDADMTDVRWVAYALATIKHETANTYRPIAEYGHGKGHPYGISDPETKHIYYGRGFVQLTWRRNYKKMSELLGVDLDSNPDLAMEPEIAWQILSVGMRDGIFTGKKLSDYIHGDHCDYTQARRIINAMDKAALIAGYATKFQTILEASSQDEPESVPDESAAPVITAATVTATTTTNAAGTVTEQKESFFANLGVGDAAKEIAKSGVTKIGTSAATAVGTAGAGSAIKAFIDGHTAELIFAAFLILLAVGIVAIVLVSKHKTKQKVIEVNADKSKNDVKLL